MFRSSKCNEKKEWTDRQKGDKSAAVWKDWVTWQLFLNCSLKEELSSDQHKFWICDIKVLLPWVELTHGCQTILLWTVEHFLERKLLRVYGCCRCWNCCCCCCRRRGTEHCHRFPWQITWQRCHRDWFPFTHTSTHSHTHAHTIVGGNLKHMEKRSTFKSNKLANIWDFWLL